MNEAEGPVLVGVTNRDHVRQLVRTAADLAVLGSGTVRLVTVAVKAHDSPFGIFEDETIVREFADASHELLAHVEAPPDVTVERDVVAARSAAGGLLSAVEETSPAALVVGWTGPTNRADAVLGSTLDSLVERVPCDLYAERVGREANGVESILLSVAGGPHVGAAARVAAAVAARNDARVVVCSVTTDSHGVDATTYAAEGREFVAAVPGINPSVETRVLEAADATAGIVGAGADHDVIVLGATRQGPLRRRIAGSVPRRVVDRTDATVIVAREDSEVGGLTARVGRLVRG